MVGSLVPWYPVASSKQERGTCLIGAGSLKPCPHFIQIGEDPEAGIDGETNHFEHAKNVGLRVYNRQPTIAANPAQGRNQAAYSTTIDVRTISELQEQVTSVLTESSLTFVREELDGRMIEISGQTEKGDTAERIRNDFHQGPLRYRRTMVISGYKRLASGPLASITLANVSAQTAALAGLAKDPHGHGKRPAHRRTRVKQVAAGKHQDDDHCGQRYKKQIVIVHRLLLSSLPTTNSKRLVAPVRTPVSSLGCGESPCLFGTTFLFPRKSNTETTRKGLFPRYFCLTTSNTWCSIKSEDERLHCKKTERDTSGTTLRQTRKTHLVGQRNHERKSHAAVTPIPAGLDVKLPRMPHINRKAVLSVPSPDRDVALVLGMLDGIGARFGHAQFDSERAFIIETYDRGPFLNETSDWRERLQLGPEDLVPQHLAIVPAHFRGSHLSPLLHTTIQSNSVDVPKNLCLTSETFSGPALCYSHPDRKMHLASHKLSHKPSMVIG